MRAEVVVQGVPARRRGSRPAVGPRGGSRETTSGDGALHIVVNSTDESASANGSVLVDELHRLSTTED